MNRSVLINTRAGVLAQRLRDRMEVLQAAFRSPETLGTVANDLMARELLERLCRPGGTFLDIGAHIGSVIDGVKRFSDASAVIAVEAIPSKAKALREKFPGVTVHCCAVGDQDGEISFFVNTRQSGYSSMYRNGGGSDDVQQIEVPIRRIDGLMPDERVDIIKIDVEGAELGVLRGGAALIARSQPVIMFESGPQETGGYTKQDMWRWLDDADYAVIVPNRVAHEDDGLGLDGFLEAHRYPRRTTNYFAVPRARRSEVRARARAILKLP